VQKFIEESWLILVMGAVFAVLLAGVQTSLAPTITVNQAKALSEAIREVVSGTDRSEEVKIEGYDRKVYRCLGPDGNLVGFAIDAQGIGFADKIHLVVGVTVDAGKITGLKVIENVETPGLGNKIADAEWAGQYRDLDPGREIVVQKRPPKPGENEVQAITGATISSKAVTKIANEALRKVRPELVKLR